jgi:hypothetical protein
MAELNVAYEEPAASLGAESISPSSLWPGPGWRWPECGGSAQPV